MYVSCHFKNKANPKVKVEIVEDSEFAGMKPFEPTPLTMVVNLGFGTVLVHMSRKEADDLAAKINGKLRVLDARELKSWNG